MSLHVAWGRAASCSARRGLTANATYLRSPSVAFGRLAATTDAARCVRREERAFRRPHVHRVVSFLRDTVRVVRDERLDSIRDLAVRFEVDLLELWRGAPC